MKLAIVTAQMYIFNPKPQISNKEFYDGMHDGSFYDKCNPEVFFETSYKDIKGETVDEEGRGYYLDKGNEWIYKEYHKDLDELCMHHPLYLQVDTSKAEGVVYVQENEIEKGKQILLDAFVTGYEKEVKKINTMLKSIAQAAGKDFSSYRNNFIRYAGKLPVGPER